MDDASSGPDKAHISFSSALGERIVQETTAHFNVGQETIIITEDKVRLCLLRYLSRLEAKRGWIAPAGIVVSVVATLITATFRDVGLEAAVWKAIFIIVAVLALAWLVRALGKAVGAPTIEDVVKEMKQAGSAKWCIRQVSSRMRASRGEVAHAEVSAGP